MLAVLFASTLGLFSEVPLHPAADVHMAQTAYRDCIAAFIAARPSDESADQALAAALAECHDAELALRSACDELPGGSTADTLAIVLDTRLEGEKAGVRRRNAP